MFKYKMKIRIRPDIAFLKPVPNPETYKFTCIGNCLPKVIYYPVRNIFSVGAEDSINFGKKPYSV